jgi:hypothetical protein
LFVNSAVAIRNCWWRWSFLVGSHPRACQNSDVNARKTSELRRVRRERNLKIGILKYFRSVH